MLRPPEAHADHTETVLDWLADYTIDGEEDALTEAARWPPTSQ